MSSKTLATTRKTLLPTPARACEQCSREGAPVAPTCSTQEGLVVISMSCREDIREDRERTRRWRVLGILPTSSGAIDSRTDAPISASTTSIAVGASRSSRRSSARVVGARPPSPRVQSTTCDRARRSSRSSVSSTARPPRSCRPASLGSTGMSRSTAPASTSSVRKACKSWWTRVTDASVRDNVRVRRSDADAQAALPHHRSQCLLNPATMFLSCCRFTLPGAPGAHPRRRRTHRRRRPRSKRPRCPHGAITASRMA